MVSTFQRHPSDELVALFSKRPFQGQRPEHSSIIFLSSDANYSPQISDHIFFKKILEYQADGVAFWKRYKCHHPFLLSEYPFKRTMDGVPFHRNFSKLGLGPEHAEHISFLELLDVPTIGMKSTDPEGFFKLVSTTHLQYIESLITSPGRKLIFVSNGVLRDIKFIQKKIKILKCIDLRDRDAGVRFQASFCGNKITEIYHFSSTQIHSQLGEIRRGIDS